MGTGKGTKSLGKPLLIGLVLVLVPVALKHNLQWANSAIPRPGFTEALCKWAVSLVENTCTYLFPWQSLVILNKPKSVITTFPLSRNIFFDFKSLCTIPLAWRYPIPYNGSRNINTSVHIKSRNLKDNWRKWDLLLPYCLEFDGITWAICEAMITVLFNWSFSFRPCMCVYKVWPLHRLKNKEDYISKAGFNRNISQMNRFVIASFSLKGRKYTNLKSFYEGNI